MNDASLLCCPNLYLTLLKLVPSDWQLGYSFNLFMLDSNNVGFLMIIRYYSLGQILSSNLVLLFFVFLKPENPHSCLQVCAFVAPPRLKPPKNVH